MLKLPMYYFLVLCTMFQYGCTTTFKTWIPNGDMQNSINWIGNQLTSDCKGVVFSSSNTAPIFVEKLVAQDILLPAHGEVDIVDGGSIIFGSQSKCLKVKSINYYDWNNYQNWNGENNVAVPHLERIPCEYDDIVLPNHIYTRIRIHPYMPQIMVKSIKFGQTNFTSSNIGTLTNSPIKDKIFFSPLASVDIVINSEPCYDKAGCLCHQEFIECPEEMSTPEIICKNPIQPEGFCHEICGAAITLTPNTDFNINDLKKHLQTYTVNTHASRIKDVFGNLIVQVIFAEESFTGQSLEEATNFYNLLKSKNNISKISLEASGQYYIEGNQLNSTVSLLFGTLFAVLLVFVVFFYIYENSSFALTRSSRIFARFDTRGGNLIVDTQSTVGSVLSLEGDERSFDNPMYGRSSSESTSIGSDEEKAIKPAVPFLQATNPLFDISLKNMENENVETLE